MNTPSPQQKVADEFDVQARSCDDMGSPLYGELCRVVAADVRSRGVCWSLLEPTAGLPFALAVALRFLGAVHRIALRGDAPTLAAFFPSCGGVSGLGVDAAFLDVVRDHGREISVGLSKGVQTNEVGRSAALFEGLGVIQRRTGHPLSLREVGCSGGLNLQMDRFRYVDGDHVGGDPTSEVVIADRWRGGVRPRLAPIEVADRAGCDPSPVDPLTDTGRLFLLGFLWPDQVDRLERTAAAIELARSRPVRQEQARATDWLGSELRALSSSAGRATVVYHSIVWQYIERDERAVVESIIETVGRTATSTNPLAWLRFEPSASMEHAELTLRLWDGTSTGEIELLARCGFHAQWVELV